MTTLNTRQLADLCQVSIEGIAVWHRQGLVSGTLVSSNTIDPSRRGRERRYDVDDAIAAALVARVMAATIQSKVARRFLDTYQSTVDKTAMRYLAWCSDFEKATVNWAAKAPAVFGVTMLIIDMKEIAQKVERLFESIEAKECA